MKPLGGSELAYSELMTRMSDKHKNDINIIVSSCRYESIDPKKINILWQQLSYDQDNVNNMKDPNFVKNIDAFVFVSNWQYEKFKKMFDVPSHKSIVIHNATKSFPIHNKPKNEKLKLIYTSMPYRGLEILVDVIERLDRNDIEVDIYSSTIIYGSEYDKEYKTKFNYLFDKMIKIPGMYNKGYANNDEIRNALLNAHIMSYPCIFEETSCMAAIEALSAGCKLVCNNLGALPESGNIWADSITYDTDRQKMVIRFTKLLKNAIDTYWTDEVQEKLQEQVKFYNKYYSWDYRIKQWENLFERVTEIKYGK